MKHEWKKHEKDMYGTKKVPSIINVPSQNFIMISGKGNPNDTDFSDRVSALYSLAYAIKMAYKSTAGSKDIDDFSVYPLEGLWKPKDGDELIKEKLEYTIMIRQPDFITADMVSAALERVKIKKNSPLYEEINFGTAEAGTYVEILHIGSFDDEPASFKKMDEFIDQSGLKRAAGWHKEIYLNNANRVEKSKLKTILRYQIQ